ncbi:hypothetical protein FEM48_Zijuj01G0221600 [Ziziphus jujuba var. spinosa]|uniref:Uncharacterized protein n=1 Tax=Ziziphus jujuba var. spinosa TaxID=714518 RepID=A0A978W3U7_ZIZJJ|nr:hypothetical protein FEM48_Zijuj01G0221600 [Ziziphus jujuba var. spinosa]
MLPKLKILKLMDMASLRNICQWTSGWPVLESSEINLRRNYSRINSFFSRNSKHVQTLKFWQERTAGPGLPPCVIAILDRLATFMVLDHPFWHSWSSTIHHTILDRLLQYCGHQRLCFGP